MFFLSFKVLAFNLFFTKFSFQLSCLNERGTPVDWFIVYKFPKLENSVIKTLKSGYGYAFITDKTLKSSKEWTLSSKNITKDDSIFGQTIGSVIEMKKNSDLSYIAYNDAAPDSKDSGSLAHSKGLFAIDSKGGFWLTHSVPNFPSIKKKFNYPKTGTKNGQTALCISLDAKDSISLNNIATNLLMIRPNIYDIKIEDSLVDRSQYFEDLEEKDWIKTESSIETTVLSKKGVVFDAFYKSKDFEEDIYSGLLGPYFKKEFLVQSWRNGAGDKLSSDCKGKYHVQNVNRIIMPNVENTDWDTTEDHSKWAISSDPTGKGYTCIADINRMKSQFKRGGGSLCMQLKQVWKIFKNSVEEVEGCRLKGSTKSAAKKKSFTQLENFGFQKNRTKTDVPKIQNLTTT